MFSAFAVAIVLAALVLGFVRWQPADDREAPPPARVVLERPAPTPRPSLPPTPAPTPLPVVAQVTPAARAERAAPHRAAPSGGGRPAPSAKPSVTVPQLALAVPTAAPADAGPIAPGAGTGSGPGTGSGTGAGTGTGAGNGTGGTGTGAVNADVPCGYVEFIRVSQHIEGGRAFERIRAVVHFRDGHAESEVFPYDWVYANPDQTDPWSARNLELHPNDPVPAQLPPAGYDARGAPALIRYILAHTTAAGHTLLEECPA